VNLTSLSTLKTVLGQYKIFPQKRFGQNFLVSFKYLQKIISAANLTELDTVLEIGPGVGTLTIPIAKRVKRVIAVEKDSKMIGILQDLLERERITNVGVVQKDARDIDGDDLKRWGIGAKPPYAPPTLLLRPQLRTDIKLRRTGKASLRPSETPQSEGGEDRHKNYKVVANLPYYIAAPIVQKFLEMEHRPQSMVLTVQKEVAERIVAKPPHMNILALSVRFYADPKIIAKIPKTCFWPKPDVDGSIIKITPHTKQPSQEFSKQFFRIIKAGFLHPRKKLVSNLHESLGVPKDKIESVFREFGMPDTIRAQNVSLSQWITITHVIAV